jgi:OOP family OmpA-OmpF porin
VVDPLDFCQGTPAGQPVDARGCPKDGDGDGVVDLVDACPATPAGEVVDGRGCTLPRDPDADGVVDPGDECPDTPAGQAVNERGCAALFAAGVTTLTLEGVNFEFDRWNLTAESSPILDRVAELLLANPEVRVEVAGHTDIRGAHAYNLRLSLARANSVRQYLIGKGVAVERLEARGYGPDQPVDSNATDAGRAKNRRVELRRLE